MRVGRAAARLALAILLPALAATAQEADSLRLAVPAAADSAALPSPSGALWRALALPGWGQVYVGQPVKAPFVVGALVGSGGLAVYLHGRYRLYRGAARYAGCLDTPDRPECMGFESDEPDWQTAGMPTFSAARQQRDAFRRNRDLAVLGTAAVYALQVLDAFVAAHLAGFDVSEDLGLHVIPTADGPAALVVIGL